MFLTTYCTIWRRSYESSMKSVYEAENTTNAKALRLKELSMMWELTQRWLHWNIDTDMRSKGQIIKDM